MPASPLLQGSIFAAGLAIGVGVTALATGKSQSKNTAGTPITPVPVAVLTSPSQTTGPSAAPLVDIARPSPASGSGIGPSSGVSFGTSALQSGAVREVAREILKYGFPGPTPDILKRTAYVAAYDRRLRHPSWTAEHLTSANLGRGPERSAASLNGSGSSGAKGDRSRSVFMEDPEVPQQFRALMKDYFRSGYDRGHMVPAADAKISQLAMDETFLLTNIAPQVGEGFNRHYWAYLEDFVRRLSGQFEDVYVFTIPLYLPSQGPDGKWRTTYEVIGNPPSISVPTHFAKVVLTSKAPQSTNPIAGALSRSSPASEIRELAIGAFVLPNAPIPDEQPLRTFVVPVETVERAAGLTLFSPAVKTTAKELCRETRCEVIVRRFDDARKQLQQTAKPSQMLAGR